MNAWSKQPEPMSAEEHEKILKVIEQADALERAEQERVGQVDFKLLNTVTIYLITKLCE